MANLFDKDKQPVEWLLEEIKGLNEMAEVSANQGNQEITQLLANIQTNTAPSGSGSGGVQPTFKQFVSIFAFADFFSSLPVGTIVHIIKLRWDFPGPLAKKTLYIHERNYAGGILSSISFYNFTEITNSSLVLSEIALQPFIQVENIKVVKGASHSGFAEFVPLAGSAYIEYTLLS